MLSSCITSAEINRNIVDAVRVEDNEILASGRAPGTG